MALDPQRLRALSPDVDVSWCRATWSPSRACRGQGPGPIGLLPQKERFHWLVAPRSTILQTSPVHSGLCADPQAALDSLFARMVLPG